MSFGKYTEKEIIELCLLIAGLILLIIGSVNFLGPRTILGLGLIILAIILEIVLIFYATHNESGAKQERLSMNAKWAITGLLAILLIALIYGVSMNDNPGFATIRQASTSCQVIYMSSCMMHNQPPSDWTTPKFRVGGSLAFQSCSQIITCNCVRSASGNYTADCTHNAQQGGDATSSPKLDCEKAGGRWGNFGYMAVNQTESCNLPTADAGKACNDNKQCQNFCQANDTAPSGPNSSGICYGWIFRPPCYKSISNGTSGTETCA
jgi:hypothetical protein